MAWWDVLAAKWLALLTRIGELVVRPLSLPPGADGLTGSSPLLLCGHDGPTGSSPLRFCLPGRDGFRQEDLSVGIKMYTSCHWLASLLVAC